eukprot:scaffold7789_cov376-Prasinococcus_capsulatus_cf.AAC.5
MNFSLRLSQAHQRRPAVPRRRCRTPGPLVSTRSPWTSGCAPPAGTRSAQAAGTRVKRGCRSAVASSPCRCSPGATIRCLGQQPTSLAKPAYLTEGIVCGRPSALTEPLARIPAQMGEVKGNLAEEVVPSAEVVVEDAEHEELLARLDGEAVFVLPHRVDGLLDDARPA